MTSLLRRASARHFFRHPWQLALSVLGVALGVAAVVGVDLATGSARRAFMLSTEAIAGRATHQIVGGPAGLPDSVYRILRVDLGVDAAAPVVEAWVRVRDVPGRTFHLLGIDPFAEAPFRGYVAAGAADDAIDVGVLLTRPRTVVLAAPAARALAVQPGDSLAVSIGGAPAVLRIAGVLDPADELSQRAMQDLMVADIATAQELTGRAGRLDRIDLRVPAGSTGRTLLARIRRALPAGAHILESAERERTTAGMTRAFDINLTALSLLALVFGTFLIYNSMTFSVVQRRPLIGLLRAQGVTRAEIFTMLLGEAAVIGVAATVLGAALGVLLGAGLVRLVARTINDLYFALGVTDVTVTAWSLVKAAVLGVGATVLAAIPPAREATATVPRAALSRAALETRSRSMARGTALAGGALFVLGCGLFLLPGRGIVPAFGAMFVIILGGALAAPLATVVLMRIARPLAGRMAGNLGRMATRGVSATLSRTGPAIAALAVAVAVGIAVGVMIDSFRGTVADWLTATLQADIYISTPSARRGAAAEMDPALVARIAAATGVAGVSTYRNAVVESAAGAVRIVAIDFFPPHHRAFTFIDRMAGDLWAAFDTSATALVSESYAYRHGLRVGSRFTLPTGRGPHAFTTGAVFHDYASEFGVVFLSRATYRRFWNEDAISSLAVFAVPGIEPDSLLARLRALDKGSHEVLFRSNRGLREASLRVFDRTFAITGVLRLLSLTVAFVGVLGALTALQLERSRELGVLRAIGLTPRELWALVTAQSGLMGLAAGLLSLPLGLVLAWIMIHIVNRRSFGWTMRMDVPAGALAQAIALAILAAVIAGLYPAWRMARTPAAAALREE